MLSREDRILSEILVSRGLVPRERIEACAKSRQDAHTSLVEVLIDRGEITRGAAEDAMGEARSLEEALAPEFSTGQRLGEFRLVRELGRGGMGIVYEAEQEPLGRRVALKVLPGGAALDDRLAIRFLREARAAGRLSHPGIVSVYTSGRAEGVLYFAMELVPGRTLAAVASGAPLAPREAARIAAEVARALAHAHEEGLVHRDVKPENILIAADGSAKITDFGLVLETSSGPFTLSRHVLGTPAYISPEQARGESVDARSDVYGLGAVLYFLLTGTAPFAGEVPSLVLARAQTERPRSLSEFRPEISPRLAAICERAMASDPAARFASAAAMATELEAFLEAPDDEAQAAAPPGEQTPRWRTAIGLTLGAAALGLAGFLVVRGVAGREAPPALASTPGPRALFQRVSDTPGRKTAPALSPDGRFLVYASDADGDVDIYLLDLGGKDAVNLTPDMPGEEASPTFSPDGRSIAFVTFARPTSILRILDLDTRQTRDVLHRTISGLVWTPDGKEIQFTDRMSDPPGPNTSATKLYAVEVSSGHVRALTAMYGAQSATSRSGKVAFVSPEGGGRADLWLLPDGGGEVTRLTDDDAIEWSPVWSADGRDLYFGSDRDGWGALYKMPIGAHPPAESSLVSSVIFPGPFYLTGGKSDREFYLIQASQAGRLFQLKLDASSGQEKIENGTGLPARFLSAQSPDFSPDGHWVVFNALTSEEDLAIGGTDGVEPGLLTHDAFLDRSPRWSPDGSRIAFESDRGGAMEIWTIRPEGNDLAPITATGGLARQPVWSPDSARLAFTIEGRGAFLIALDAGPDAAEPLGALPDGGAFEPWSWSPDGRAIAGASHGIILYTLSTRSYRRLTDFGTAPVWLDARRLVFTNERELRLLDVRTGKTRLLASFGPAQLAPRFAVSRDGSALLVSLSASPREIWRVEIKE